MASVYNRGTKAKPNWWAKYKDADGVWKAAPTKMPTKAAAEQWVAALTTRVRNGQVGIIELTDEERARKTITVKELFDKFNAEYAPPKLKNPKEYRCQTKAVFGARIEAAIGSTAAASITSTDVERLRDQLLAEVPGVRDGYAPSSVSWTMARLSKVFVWARKMGYIDCPSPVAGVEHPHGEPSLDLLSKEEVTKLLAHTAEHRPDIHSMVATAIYAGLRKGELYGLRWIDVNLERAQLTVARSYRLAPKSGKPRYLPIHPALLVILRQWKERCPKTDEGLVFPVPEACIGGYRMGDGTDMLGITPMLKLAGCHVPQPKPWHGLRHTFASHFMMAGGNILTLQKLLGHASLDMTLIYAHLAPDFMAAELARMSFPTAAAGVASLDEERRKRELEATPQLQEANANQVNTENDTGKSRKGATSDL